MTEHKVWDGFLKQQAGTKEPIFRSFDIFGQLKPVEFALVTSAVCTCPQVRRSLSLLDSEEENLYTEP